MPRNVRNFWVELRVDGKQTRIETGPQAKDGGFELVVLQRDQSSIIRALEVSGRVTSDGRIVLLAESFKPKDGPGGELRIETKR